MRVLHAPTDTAGQAWGLSRAERRCGVDSTVVVYRAHEAGFGSDVDLHFERTPLPFNALKAGGLLLWALARFDVFHFNWGSSLLDYPRSGLDHLDLPLLKRLGKRVVVTYPGSDARNMERAVAAFPVAAGEARQAAAHLLGSDAERRRRIENVTRRADATFVLNPDLCRDVPGAELLPYASVDFRCFEPLPPRAEGRLRIGHAPTHRGLKGTRYVIAACETLRSRGVQFELDLIEGVSHDEAQERLRRVDLFVDQLLLGWYGAVAVEAMALGLPVLCYLDEEDLRHSVPWRDTIPIVRTSPATLADDLERLLLDPTERRQRAVAGRRFVEERHDPVQVAARVIERYRS